LAGTPPVLHVFLSHGYRASAINLYFYRLFSPLAQLTFEVDVPKTTLNVTRLERMIRNVDAFIGIYAYDHDPQDGTPSHHDLMAASRYFRFELDLALRSGKPALVLYDRLYGDVFQSTRNISFLAFDSRQVTGVGSAPTAARFVRAFEKFRRTIMAAKRLSLALDRPDPAGVGLLVPPRSKRHGYGVHERKIIRTTLKQYGYLDVIEIPWPRRIDWKLCARLQELDWVLADLSDQAAASFVGHLHGAFVPTMRLLQTSPGATQHHPPIEEVLYHGVEVGYRKDILRWWDGAALEEGLSHRLNSLQEQGRWISTAADAERYFQEASLRKEPVFLSYAQEDQLLARRVRDALKRSFADVFDYRDGQSMEPARPWMQQLFERLDSSAIGIALLSKSYLDSPYCRSEAESLKDRQLKGDLHFITVKLYEDSDLDLPGWLKDIQYLRFWEYDSADDLVDRIRRSLGK
jgi:TIR domain